jgi:hypothetical protein
VKKPPLPVTSKSHLWTAVGVAAFAVALTYLFWQPLYNGWGFIGGDTYPYFYPQKAFLADRLKAGEFPIWNNLVGQGYPLVAESQTGVLYPPNLLLYRWLDLQTAYNVSHLLHAMIAVVGTWLLARRLGVSGIGSLLTALTFVGGWFPARSCLEWAMIGGAWFPLVLWTVESYLQTGRRRWLAGASACVALFLLAGHFHLAFITLLATAGYVLLRPRGDHPSVEQMPSRSRGWIGIGVAIAVGFLLAAVQLLPTLELRGRSQRFEFSSEHNPLYGRLPPNYLTHIIAPWSWFRDGVNPDDFLGGSNRVEAHLYCGLLPLALALFGAALVVRERRWSRNGVWIVLGLAFLLLALGSPLVWLQQLPGFGFFRGAGRYGMVTAFAVALLAGFGFDRIMRARQPTTTWLVAGICLGVTAWDLSRVVPYVSYVVAIPSPLQMRDKSAVRQLLSQFPAARVFGPGQNVLTLANVSQFPVYLGIGPAEYFDPQFAMPPTPKDGPVSDELIAAQVRWMRDAGVTHILGQRPWDPDHWPIQLVWTGFDELFNRAWGQFDSPLYLYELIDAPGRVVLQDGAVGEVRIADSRANEVSLQANLTEGGLVVLKELDYPGWEATVDGGQTEKSPLAPPFRAVGVGPGEHRIVWRFRSASLRTGTVISAAALLLGLAALFWGRRGGLVERPRQS